MPSEPGSRTMRAEAASASSPSSRLLRTSRRPAASPGTALHASSGSATPTASTAIRTVNGTVPSPQNLKLTIFLSQRAPTVISTAAPAIIAQPSGYWTNLAT